MSLKRLYEDVKGVSCPICGAPILKDASNLKKVKYFCSGKKSHNLTNNRKIIAVDLADAIKN